MECPKTKPVVCYSCNKPGDIACKYDNAGNVKGSASAPKVDPRSVSGAITPKMKIRIDGKAVWALIDTGCMQTFTELTATWKKHSASLTAVGRLVTSHGEVLVNLTLARKTVKLP